MKITFEENYSVFIIQWDAVGRYQKKGLIHPSGINNDSIENTNFENGNKGGNLVIFFLKRMSMMKDFPPYSTVG